MTGTLDLRHPGPREDTPPPTAHPGGPAGRIAIVIPTVGRPSLAVLWDGLRRELHQTCGGTAHPDGGPAVAGPGNGARFRDAAEPIVTPVVVVDDRLGGPLLLPGSAWSHPSAAGPTVVRSGGRGPAAARNVGWRTAVADARDAGRPVPEWIVFLDDDVLVGPGWGADLLADLGAAPADVGAVQGRLSVPLPRDRHPTDWERGTAALADGCWLTADIAYRTAALASVAGFDERFPRAFREDADLAHRVRAAGWRLTRGNRTTVHPVRPASSWVSVRTQAGNADDALLRARYGRRWRRRLAAGPGRTPVHVATVGAAATALAAAAHRPLLTAASALAWAGLTADFARRRIAPGPRPGEPGWATEAARMAVTSAVIPFAAVGHRIAGAWRHRDAPAWPLPVRAVLFDRDGTLVHDVPYNGDPTRVRLVDGAEQAVARIRAAGLAVGLVTNQSGVARGLLRPDQVDAVNERVGELVGGFDTVQVCPHGPAGPTGGPVCRCRKPEPGLVLRAAAALRVAPAQCVVVGDIGADVRAAVAAGAAGILVPTAVTRVAEIAAAEWVADDVGEAVDLVLTGRLRREAPGIPARAGVRR